MKIGYKIVRRDEENKLISCRMRPDRGESVWTNACTRYAIGRSVRPNKGYGPLAVFNSFKEANNFRDHLDLIYLCVYKPSKKRFLRFTERSTKVTNLPSGTDFASEVVLVNEV